MRRPKTTAKKRAAKARPNFPPRLDVRGVRVHSSMAPISDGLEENWSTGWDAAGRRRSRPR